MKKWALLLAAVLLLGSLAGCQKAAEGEVGVQSVADICGLGGVGLVDRFAGVVASRGEVEIKKEAEKNVAQLLVKEGDAVKAGQVLFTYEQAQAELDLEKGKLELPDKPIILTFDDGYEDNYTTMLPMLEERGMKAVVYMVTNDIGRPNYLSWDQLRDMQDRGIEIGSHTANHQPLTHLDPEKQAEEMRLSKLLMEWNGIRTVFSFSYPNGAYTDAMPGMLAENEYLTAVTGDAGLNTFATNPYLLQRVNIPHPRFGLTEFKLRLWKAAVMTKLGVKQH